MRASGWDRNRVSEGRGPKRWLGGAAFLAFLLLALLPGGCLFKTNFSDMSARIDELEIPEHYERWGRESHSGTKPAFFGDYPKVTRGYRSPDDLETTCAELERRLSSRSPHVVRREGKCHLGFQVRSGASVTATGNFRYDATVTALERDDGPGTWVNVTLSDLAP
jgi:hypothetical protein